MTTAIDPDRPLDADTTGGAESRQIGQYSTAVHDFHTREELERSAAQRDSERVGAVVGRPAFVSAIGLPVATWMVLTRAPAQGPLAQAPS